MWWPKAFGSAAVGIGDWRAKLWPITIAWSAAATIARMFHDNFESYADGVSAGVRAAGPKLLKGAEAVPVSAPGEG